MQIMFPKDLMQKFYKASFCVFADLLQTNGETQLHRVKSKPPPDNIYEVCNLPKNIL